jgi:glycosyltransferase involved in cell wall biosynthesis
VSIGLPVRNGEPYLSGAIDALLAQTHSDFELIICDNASTDQTEAICRAYVERDSRVRYYRNRENIGIIANFNRTVSLARGTYFRWASSDDLSAPTFVERCLEVMESDPSVVLCHPRTMIIDGDGNELYPHPHDGLDTGSSRPSVRMNELIRVYHWCVQQFGLTRTETLRSTGLLGTYPQSDRVLLVELALLGRFHEIDEHLLFFRSHEQASLRLSVKPHEFAWNLNPATHGRPVFPVWRLLGEWYRAVSRSPVSGWERMMCYVQLARWPLRGLNAPRLARDVVTAGMIVTRSALRRSSRSAGSGAA